MKPATMLTFIVLDLIAAAHLVRLVVGLDVRVGGTVVPVWFSALGFVFFGGLAVGLWREHVARLPAT